MIFPRLTSDMPAKSEPAHPQLFHGLHRCHLSLLPPPDHFAKLRMLYRPASHVHSLFLCDGNSVPLMLEDIRPLQFRHRAEHREHELPRGCYDACLFRSYGVIIFIFAVSRVHMERICLEKALVEIDGYFF